MNMSIQPTSATLVAEAESARAQLEMTVHQLRYNLQPAQLADEAKAAIGQQASATVDTARDTLRRHPVAVTLVAIGAAVIVGCSVGSKRTNGVTGAKNLGSVAVDQVKTPGLRAKVAAELAGLAEASFVTARARYDEKLTQFRDTARQTARGLTEQVLSAGEKMIETLIADMAAKIGGGKS